MELNFNAFPILIIRNGRYAPKIKSMQNKDERAERFLKLESPNFRHN